MADQQEYERNNAAYRRMKDKIAQSYPEGWFVGIADEQVVGGAATFRDLESLLDAKGLVAPRTFVVEAGG